MNGFKAVIFDMDGVLVDSEPFHIQNEKSIFKKLGLKISDEEHSNYTGTSTEIMWSTIIQNKNLKYSISELTDFTIRESLEFFRSLSKIDPMPGVVNLLNFLESTGVPIAVASSSDPESIELLLGKSGLIKYFNIIVSSTETGKSKPEPDVFLLAAKKLNVSPEFCLVIEDSKNGVKAAKAANMFCIAFSGGNSGNQNTNEADLYYNRFSEIEKYLKGVIAKN